MQSDRWQRVEALFRQLVELSPEERDGVLDEACGGDAEVRAEVASLLRAHEGAADSFLRQLDHGEASELLESVAQSAVPDRIGPYRLERELGRGGMGVVYLAERVGQFEQQVALKLVKRGMDSDTILQRFLRERQILAHLEHSNIARLIDGGVTEEGQPWFAMEFVEGVPLTTWCDERRLDLRQRIELFVDVCTAVDYAHRNLVVHRDLKPSNVLVTVEGDVKLLDFGIAKLLGGEEDGRTLFETEVGLRLVTPGYGAPEQLRGEPVTTATDVYSLGVILYELLCGSRPYEPEKRSLEETLALVDTAAPLRPSARVTVVAASARRSTERRTRRGGRESAIDISPLNSNLAVAGAVIWPIGTRQEMFFSTDGGSSWTPSQSLPQGGALGDPTIAWSSDGQFVYTASLSFSLDTLYFYRSADNGQSWTDLANEPGGDSRREIGVSGSDKEYLHVDHSPSSPFKDRVYMTWDNFSQGNTMKFARSSDFGNTWTTTSFNSAPGGIAGDLTTDAAGKIYYLYPAFGDRTIRLLTSNNGGVSFSSATAIANTNASFSFTVPSQNTRFVLVYVSTDTDRSGGLFDGSVYASWTDQRSNGRAFIQVAYSRDGGNSWTLTEPHSPDTSPDRYHQWLEVDDDGNVHVIYYDTQDDASRDSVHLYHSVSADGGQSWTAQRLTSQNSPGPGDGFDFGDYNGMAITMNQLIAAYSDNRDGSVDMWAAGTVLGEPGYTLLDTDPGNAGETNSWTAENGTPLGDHAVYYGLPGGTRTVSNGACVNVTLSLGTGGLVGEATADASGSATVSRMIPDGVAGRTATFQALDLTTCQVSNVVTTDL